MRSRSGQEMIQAAMILPVVVFVLVIACWVFLWQLGLHTTQFVAQESARAASTSSGLASDPDAVTADPDADDATATDIAFVSSNAQVAGQSAIDRSFLHGVAAGSPCASGTPPAGQVCFIQMPPCTQGTAAGQCATQGVQQCLNGASSQQSLWVCQWYEVPASGSSSPYKVKVVVVGWFSVGLPVLGGSLPIASSDEESIQRCGGCPG